MIIRNLASVPWVPKPIHRVFSSPPMRTAGRFGVMAHPENLPLEYWSNILEESKLLKKKLQENEKECLKLLTKKHVTLMCLKPHTRFQIACTYGCDLLGARYTSICNSEYDTAPELGDIGKILSKLTDLVVTHGYTDEILKVLFSRTDVPMISSSSDSHCMHKALSDMMTFQEHFGSLKELNLAWIGPPTPLFNSYMVLCTKFDIHFRYFLTCRFGRGRMSPVMLLKPSVREKIEALSAAGFKCIEDTINEAHIIATSTHGDGSSKITLNAVKGANPDYVLMHSLPRTWKEISDEVFHSERNLSWTACRNYLYVAMALILTNLRR